MKHKLHIPIYQCSIPVSLATLLPEIPASGNSEVQPSASTLTPSALYCGGTYAPRPEAACFFNLPTWDPAPLAVQPPSPKSPCHKSLE